MIAEHLNALHTARTSYIQCEASKKIKTALKHQTRTATSKSFQNGEMVYYKRRGEKEWRGPAVVLGIEGKQILVKHGGTYYRVSPCNLQSIRGANDGNKQETKTYTEDSIQTAMEGEELQIGKTTPVHVDNTIAISPSESTIPDTITPEPTECSSSSTYTESKTVAPEVALPKVSERVRFIDPDTNQQEDYVVISRAGKAGGRHKYWLNVKNIKTNAIKSIDFEIIEEWNQIDDESAFTVDLSHGVIQAQKVEGLQGLQ